MVPSSVSKVSYTGDGVTNNFPITFAIGGIRSTEIEVYLVDVATGTSTKLESNYSVDLNVPEVVYPLSGNAITGVNQILIARKLELDQLINLKNQGPLPGEVIEQGFDRAAMQFQQMQEQIDRTIKADISQDQATLDEVTAQAAANAATATAAATAAASSATQSETALAAAQDAQAAAEDARDAAQLVAGIQVATQVDAEGASNNTKYMTPLRVKQEVEKAGAVAIPAGNITGLSTIPTGIICMWSGTIATVPSGWYFCDGSNGTPDLRNRMIMGAQEDESSIAKTNVSGALTQTGGEAAHTMTLAELVPHNHVETRWDASGGNSRGLEITSTNVHGNTPTDLSTLNAGGGAAFNVLNPYYALAFIMKA